MADLDTEQAVMLRSYSEAPDPRVAGYSLLQFSRAQVSGCFDIRTIPEYSW